MDEMEALALAAAAKKKREASAANADMSLMGRLKDNFVGVDDGVMSVGEKIGTFLNKSGESATLGLVGDEASALAAHLIPGGQNFDERLAFERQNEAQLEAENPGAALAAEIGGGVVGALLPGGAIGQLARGGLGLRAAASAGAGAGMGGIYGFMEGEGAGRAQSAQEGAAWGAGAGAAAPLVGGVVKGAANRVMQRKPINKAMQSAKSAVEQRAGSQANYRAFKDADAQITPDALERLQGRVAGRIDDAGAPKIPGPAGKTPKSGRQINETLDAMVRDVNAAKRQNPAKGQNPAIPLVALEDVRKFAGRLGRETKDFRPTHGAAIANQAVNEIDQFIDSLTTADVPVGDAQKAVSALKKARSMWRSAIKTQMLEDATDEADNYLSGTASGLRNQVKSLLRKNKKTKLFSAEEEAALKKVIGNTALGRSVRMLGDGLGAKMATLGGGMTGGIAGAAIGKGASELASNINDSMASRNMEIAKALISQGGLQNLPQLPQSTRNLIERLVRRTGVASGQ